MAKIAIFVRQYYLGVDFDGISMEQVCNATAGLGGPGQLVVFTEMDGTILCMSTGRLYSPNLGPDLNARFRVVSKEPAHKQEESGLMGAKSTS